MPRSLAAPLICVLIAGALAGCGGAGLDFATETTTSIPGGADPADVQVIDEWSKTLSDGDIDGAAGFFAIPSIAENGPQLQIETLNDAKIFNASLPCGATLVEATTEGDFTVATFKLGERPGAGRCGAGTDGEAQTAFRIEDGKIAEWRRVVSGGGGPHAPSSSA